MIPDELPEFHDQQVWDARIRAYRLVSVNQLEADRIRRVREENQRRQEQFLSRYLRVTRTS